MYKNCDTTWGDIKFKYIYIEKQTPKESDLMLWHGQKN